MCFGCVSGTSKPLHHLYAHLYVHGLVYPSYLVMVARRSSDRAFIVPDVLTPVAVARSTVE